MADHDQVKRREVLIHNDRYPLLADWIERNPRSWVKAMLDLAERSLREGELPTTVLKTRRVAEPDQESANANALRPAAQAAAPPAHVVQSPPSQSPRAQPQHPQQVTGNSTSPLSTEGSETSEERSDSFESRKDEPNQDVSQEEIAKRAAKNALMQNMDVF